MTAAYEEVFGLRPEALECPYTHFAEARREDPVSFNDRLGMWIVTDHRHVCAVLRDARTFSTKEMLGPATAAEWQRMIDLAAATDDGKQLLGPDYGASPRKTLLFADPPEHTKHRKLISSALSAPAIASWEPRIRATAQRFVDELALRGRAEFVTEFAAPYTMTVIADILGLPSTMVPQMMAWTRGFNSMIGNPLTDEQVRELVEVRLGFDIYFDEQMQARQESPTTDLISRIVEYNATSADPLGRDELLMVLQLAMVGGSDTSSTALSRMMEFLCDEPREWNRLRADPEAVGPFIEELLRTESPLQGLFRVVTKDVELGGKKLAAGDTVWISLAAANRDPAVFAEPDDKVMERANPASQYVMFGGGPHLCPGAALTRLELRVVLEMLLARFPSVRREVPRSERIRSFMFYGPTDLVMRVGYQQQANS
ncbi:cytochrome P450 [Nocardia sp. JW2]|uniref:cytochrome P450 n=1 Tax=Nocardia sp. JW2 TaxID=3450738 RepID=UPI003F42BAE6